MATGNTTGAPSSGVFQAIKGALGIFSGINKAEGMGEAQNPTPIDEYESSYSEIEVIELISMWKESYRTYYMEGIESSQQTAFEYWIGKQRSDEADQIQGSTMLVDNKIFEAIETFIPIATRANPDPLVQADPGELGQKLAKDVKNVLVHEADVLKLRMQLKGMLRDWMICRMGLLKVGFDPHTNQNTLEKINPKRWMGDKEGHWEFGRFTGEWQAESKKASASKLMKLFPSKTKEIKDKANAKKGTKIEYTEWWYKDRDVFYTMDETVLGKFKNPHWNYDIPEAAAELDDMGNELMPAQEFVEGKNLFKEPRAPYIGLVIFSTGIQPHDETSLILQNIGIQDRINKTARQIDRNVEGMNNGMIVSDKFTADQASQAASALRRGVAIRAPGEDVNKSVSRFPPAALPRDVFQSLEDMRNELRNIFGTSGSTPEGVESQKTVRGKILVNQLDSSRIGGGITEYIEQVADSFYNWMVQLMFVHWTDAHVLVASGQVEGTELVQIKNTDLATLKSLVITVKEGSLIPKDPLTQRNEAIDLWSAGAIDPITFYKRLDYADPMNAASQLLIWQMVQKGQLPPQAYIPNFGQNNPALAQAQAMGMNNPNLPQNVPGPGGVGGPAVSPLTQKGVENNPAPESVGAQSKQLIQSIPTK